jgi:hypothetical protein
MPPVKIVRRRFIFATEEVGSNIVLGITVWAGPENNPPASRQIGNSVELSIPRLEFFALTDDQIQERVEAVCSTIEAKEKSVSTPDAVTARINEKLNG